MHSSSISFHHNPTCLTHQMLLELISQTPCTLVQIAKEEIKGSRGYKRPWWALIPAAQLHRRPPCCLLGRRRTATLPGAWDPRQTRCTAGVFCSCRRSRAVLGAVAFRDAAAAASAAASVVAADPAVAAAVTEQAWCSWGCARPPAFASPCSVCPARACTSCTESSPASVLWPTQVLTGQRESPLCLLTKHSH